MGLFDSVWVTCPSCGRPVEFQSKEDECCMMDWSIEQAPSTVLWDIMNTPHYHKECGAWVALIDPKHPPGGPRPAPDLTARLVRAPENPTTHSQGFKWWPDDKPFTFDDLTVPPNPRRPQPDFERR